MKSELFFTNVRTALLHHKEKYPKPDKPNAVLLDKTLEQISIAKDKPIDGMSWEQETWVADRDCGTAMCFAGWAATLNGAKFKNSSPYVANEPSRPHVANYAEQILGLSHYESEFLFDGRNDYDDLVRLVEIIKDVHNLL